MAAIGVVGALTALLAGCGANVNSSAGRVDRVTPLFTATTTVTPSMVTSTATPAATPVAPQALSDMAPSRSLGLLATLAVKGRAPMTGYDRALFGQAWSDDANVQFGHNGCDTRNDILRRDLTGVVLKPGSNGCTVLSGTLLDPYTGSTIVFKRGPRTSTAVQIDHMVALGDAWQKGAQQLSPQQRQDFANDPRNLQAVDGPTNQAKGDGDAATWLPPNKAYRCTYVSRQIEAKAAYHLWVTPAEKDAMTRVLTGCGGLAPVPAAAIASSSTPSPVTSNDMPDPAYTPPPTTPAPVYIAPQNPAGDGVYYASCAAARAAGAAPLRLGQPGYRAKLDRDGDGVACE